MGPAHVGEEDHRRPLFQEIADGGQGGDDAGIVVDHAGFLIMGNVEITTQEDLLSGDVNV